MNLLTDLFIWSESPNFGVLVSDESSEFNIVVS